MITLQKVKAVLENKGFSPLSIELFMHMYTDLPYENRQVCAQQLTTDPSVATMLYELLNNKNNFKKTGIDAETFGKNELSILTNYLTI